MKKRTPNTESTVKERLRVVIGALMSFSGLITVTVIGMSSNYGSTTVWIVGIALIVGGLLIANSIKLIEFIAGLSN